MLKDNSIKEFVLLDKCLKGTSIPPSLFYRGKNNIDELLNKILKFNESEYCIPVVESFFEEAKIKNILFETDNLEKGFINPLDMVGMGALKKGSPTVYAKIHYFPLDKDAMVHKGAVILYCSEDQLNELRTFEFI